MLDRRLAGPSVVDADQIAIDALGVIGSDPKLMNRFLDVTGIEADGIRQAAAQPGFLVGVLDFLLSHEPDLVSFCHATATPLEIVQVAREKLDAGR